MRGMLTATRAEAERLLADSRDTLHAGVDYAAMLRWHLIDLCTTGLLPSKAMVTLCWYITMASGKGVSDLGRNPASLHGNATRVVGAALGSQIIQEGCLVELEVPLYNKTAREAARGIMWLLPFLKSWHWTFKHTKLAL